jgi:secreted PhoX family phosphatase
VGRKHNLGLLEEGTLHVAKLRDDGSGGWILLVHGQGPLTAANGFASRAEVLINTPGCRRRGRRDQDGPARGHPAQPRQRPGLRQPDQQHRQDPAQTDPPNPRGPNPWGHVLEIREDGDDADSTSFTWRIFLLCGDPDDPGTYFAGYPKDKVSPIGSPDNMTFDNEGNIWLASDGTQPTGGNNGLFACPTEGSERGHVQLFATVPVGAETCGPLLTRDNRSLFIAVQHPGEGGTVAAPTSHWPAAGGQPAPAGRDLDLAQRRRRPDDRAVTPRLIAAGWSTQPVAISQLGWLPGRHLRLQPMLGRCGSGTGWPSRTRSRAWRSRSPVTGRPLRGVLSSKAPR